MSINPAYPTHHPAAAVAQAVAGDADHDKFSLDGLGDRRRNDQLPSTSGRPSIGSDTAPVAGEATPGAPQLPFDGCGEPKGQEETLCDAS